MRVWLTPSILCAALGAAAIAAGQEQTPVPIQVHVDATVTPDRAGTPRHPQPVKIDVRAHITMPDAYDPPLVDSVDVWFPRGGLYRGGAYPRCSRVVLARRGPRACPRGAIMGHGSGNATADTVVTHPQITIVNGGQRRVYFYTVLTNPARVQAPIVGTVTKLDGRWSYRLHAVIPPSLQVVAGVPIVLHDLHLAGGSTTKDWLATTGCPASHRWRYHVVVTFTTGQEVTYDNAVRCRPAG
jgi:hypothetical protein